MDQRRGIGGSLEVGIPLISGTVAIIAAAVGVAATLVVETAPRILIFALVAILIAVLWTLAIRNSRVERDFRTRLKAEHPGALVERVRLWSLPHGRVHADVPIHFLVADASEITFETIDQTVLLRIPVAELGLIDLVTAQHDRAKDKALTLIYGDDEAAVQLFTVTYSANDRLATRLRTAIGWPAAGTP
jgi:hypothetical protein